MSKFKELGKNTVLVFVGNIGSKMIAFLMLPFYTKWLSVEDYGTSDNALIYVNLLIGIFTLSISESIFIFPKDQEFSKQKQFFSSGFIGSLILLFVTAFLLYGTKEILIEQKILKSITDNMEYIYLLIVSLFLQTFLQQFARSINKILVYAISGVVLTLLTAFFSIVLVHKFGLKGFFIAQILSYFISAIYAFMHSKSYKYFSFNALSFDRYKEMAKYSVPLIPNAIMWWLVGSLNRPIMEEYLGMHAIGLFAVAYKFPSLINVLFSVFMVSWQISVIEEYKKENYEKFYNQVLKLVFIFLGICVITLSALGKSLTALVTDVKFLDAWLYIPILSLASLFSSISGFVGANFSATRESKYYFYSSVWGAVIAVIFNFLLIPLWGLYGAVISTGLSHFVMMLSRIKYSWRSAKIYNLAFYIMMLLIITIMILCFSFLENTTILISVFALGIICFCFLIRKDFYYCLHLLKKIKL
ncbi:lipopolysaccharide biosynthesis protein [Flavobacterium mesophilum]|uniref:lipopolysaccharide biosynthesis protein n=1 Tax=Flavobacterium mesophilum TaxID=3143495 RepID=UPI0031E3684E